MNTNIEDRVEEHISDLESELAQDGGGARRAWACCGRRRRASRMARTTVPNGAIVPR